MAAIRFPRLSNVTDLDALACEPGVEVTMTADPVTVRSADVVLLPGSRATVSDLDWLRSTGLADAVRAAAGRATGDEGARLLLQANPGLIDLVDCGDAAAGRDVDTPEDLPLLER